VVFDANAAAESRIPNVMSRGATHPAKNTRQLFRAAHGTKRGERGVNVLSLCSGVGGLELGLRLAEPSARTVCYVEREAFAAAILAARMDEGSLEPCPIWASLNSFDGPAWRGVVDCVTAGFPCQPWSQAGKRLGTEDERWIWPDIVRIIRDIGPEYVFLENVPGLVSGGGLGLVLADLALLGFDAEWMPLSAREVGAPHRRQRIFILAYARHSTGGVQSRLERNEPPEEPTGYGVLGYAAGSRLSVGAEQCGEDRSLRNEARRPRFGGSGADVADAEPRAVLEKTASRASEPGGDAASNPSGDLGYTDIARTDPESTPSGPRRATSESGGAMADAPRLPGGERSGRERILDGDPSVAISESDGRQGIDESEGTVWIQRWPPAPDDRKRWAEVLQQAPELEPAVRRVAHGIPYRVDRLRALGNAVVPQLVQTVTERIAEHERGRA